MKHVMKPLPVKVTPDYMAVVAEVKENGYMLLPVEGVNEPSLHSSLSRHGLGMKQYKNGVEQIGWLVGPKKEKR